MESILIFVSGAVLLIYSAEKLIGYLVGVASGLRVSVFLLAIIFTGIEFDDVVLGVALNLEELGGVALGVVIGTTLSISGVVLALAAIIAPTEVKVPREYLYIFAASPFVLLVFALMAPLTAAHGVVLLLLSGLFIAWIVVRESRAETPVFRDAELYEAYAAVRRSSGGTVVREAEGYTRTGDQERGNEVSGRSGRERFAASIPFTAPGGRFGWAKLGLAVVALTGLVIGAATTAIGTEGILETYGLEGTIFGATIATVVLTVEDIFLTVEPARKGAPEIGIGNVIGSVIFSVTGKLGIILLAGTLVIGSDVLTWHLPALMATTALAAYFVSTGRLQRWHGFVLLGLYVLYWIISFAVFGVVPDVD